MNKKEEKFVQTKKSLRFKATHDLNFMSHVITNILEVNQNGELFTLQTLVDKLSKFVVVTRIRQKIYDSQNGNLNKK